LPTHSALYGRKSQESFFKGKLELDEISRFLSTVSVQGKWVRGALEGELGTNAVLANVYNISGSVPESLKENAVVLDERPQNRSGIETCCWGGRLVVAKHRYC
jgi:hypothetical protein